jgi:hypothetical protein
MGGAQGLIPVLAPLPRPARRIGLPTPRACGHLSVEKYRNLLIDNHNIKQNKFYVSV